MLPWFTGQVVLGALGRYGGWNVLPAWIDIIVMIAFSLVIFRVALAMTLTAAQTAEAVGKDAHQLELDT